MFIKIPKGRKNLLFFPEQLRIPTKAFSLARLGGFLLTSEKADATGTAAADWIGKAGSGEATPLPQFSIRTSSHKKQSQSSEYSWEGGREVGGGTAGESSGDEITGDG
jgi:hypothetical protein